MAKRIVIRKGDIFCAEIESRFRVYFQYICQDVSGLNSPVIAVFKTRYPINSEPDIENVTKDKVWFYAHCSIRDGIHRNVWYKVGSSKRIVYPDNLYFGTASHSLYIPPKTREVIDPLTGEKVTIYVKGVESIDVDPMTNWFIWKLNEPHLDTKILPKKYNDITEIGTVFPSECIIDRMTYGYYRWSQDEYDALKRIPLPDVSSFVHREIDGYMTYLHFIGSDVVREAVITGEGTVKLSGNAPASNGFRLRKMKFWEINWAFTDFITESDFDDVWRK